MIKLINTVLSLLLCVIIFTACNSKQEKQTEDKKSTSNVTTEETTNVTYESEIEEKTDFLIFPEPKNQLEKTINLKSAYLDPSESNWNSHYRDFLYDFDGDGIPEFLTLEKGTTPMQDCFWCSWNIDSLLGKEIVSTGYFGTEINDNDCVKMEKYYDKENDQYFYITKSSWELPHRTKSVSIEKHVFYNDGIYSECVAVNHFYCKNDDWDFCDYEYNTENDKWYLSTNKVNGRDIGGTGFVEDTEIDGKPYFYDAYQKYISQYEFIEEISFDDITFDPPKEPELEKFLKDYDKRFCESATRPPISIYDSKYIPKGDGIEYQNDFNQIVINPKHLSNEDTKIYEDYSDNLCFRISDANPDFSVLKRFPNVTSISLMNATEDDSDFKIDLSELNEFPQIKSLSLCFDLQYNTESISNLKYVDSLTIGGKQFGNLKFLSDMQTLKILRLNWDTYINTYYYRPLYNLKNLAVIDIYQVGSTYNITQKQKDDIKENMPNVILVNSSPQS